MNLTIDIYLNTTYLIIAASVLTGIVIGRLTISSKKYLESIHGKNPVTIDYDSYWMNNG
jgi:hypothetical protein|tara:strand:- start:175 stop:351 length:177 start_codon:yes stop_codon:yes gene_type:complete